MDWTYVHIALVTVVVAASWTVTVWLVSLVLNGIAAGMRKGA
jgi:hypothetical protein